MRLRGTCIALMPLLIGGIIHAFSCANEYDLSMSSSAVCSLPAWKARPAVCWGRSCTSCSSGRSSIGALLILLVLFIVSLLVACRITPQALYDMVRPPEYEYEDEEERSATKHLSQLPNIHEAAAAYAQRRGTPRTP